MTTKGNVSKVIRFLGDFNWDGIPREKYKDDGSNFKGVSRANLIGMRNESPLFHLRYFEIAPGGYTTYEQHKHEHVVYIIRGQGIFRNKDDKIPATIGDILYTSPDSPHQLRNESSEPFGFLCIVNAERDKPVPLEGGSESSCIDPEIIEKIENEE